MHLLSLLFAFYSLLAFSAETTPLLRTVPDVEQSTDYSCGPSALQSVLAYYGLKVSEQELMRETNVDPEAGTDIGELVKAAINYGIGARAVENSSITDLEEALQKSQLIIILGQAWRGKLGWFRKPIPWENEWDSGHYMVVIGTDEENIYFEDPWIKGNRGFIPKNEFNKRWHGHSDTEVPTQHQAIFFEGTPDTSRRALKLNTIYVN